MAHEQSNNPPSSCGELRWCGLGQCWQTRGHTLVYSRLGTPNVRKSGMLHLHQIITLQIVEENQQS